MEVLTRLEALARDIVKRALDDAIDVEVRITRHDGYGYEMHGRELAPKMALGRVQVGLRALTHEGMALAATTSLDVEENLAALRASLKSARPTPLSAFADGAFDPDLSGHDDGWDAFATGPAALKDLAAAMRDGLYREHGGNERLEAAEGEVGFGTNWTAIATKGGHAAFKQSSGHAYAQLNGGHYGILYLDRAPGTAEREKVAGLAAHTFEAIPERMVTPAELGLSGVVPAIFHPQLTESILRIAAQEKFLGSSKRTGLTRFEAGQALWDPKLTLVDTGRVMELATSRPVDDELTATQETPLIEGGAFAGLVWSQRSAAEGETTSTGNGYRSPMLVEDPNEAPVRDRLSGLVMDAGDTPLEALIGSVDKGIYVHACLGLHGADKARAAFSAAVYDGFAVEDGKITAALTPGSWNAAGLVFPEGENKGIFGEVTVSRDREVTGSARLPWILGTLSV